MTYRQCCHEGSSNTVSTFMVLAVQSDSRVIWQQHGFCITGLKMHVQQSRAGSHSDLFVCWYQELSPTLLSDSTAEPRNPCLSCTALWRVCQECICQAVRPSRLAASGTPAPGYLPAYNQAQSHGFYSHWRLGPFQAVSTCQATWPPNQKTCPPNSPPDVCAFACSSHMDTCWAPCLKSLETMLPHKVSKEINRKYQDSKLGR